MAARFVVGIDLGTTNTACAYVDTQAGRAIRVFEVPQLVLPGEVRAEPTLPSVLYLAGAHELPPGSLDLPWATGRDWCVGRLAREQGARVPGRLVVSAKSWLCHAGVDRTAAILPWGADPDAPRVSPVEASARILSHLRDAWDSTLGAPLAEQEVVLTVPASFDEVARELTLAAAREAGLPAVVLLEEPQAAFYAWLVRHEQDWKTRVAAHPLVLVVDVGGGTTDLSLIAGRVSRGELGLERVAVGEHLLLGGDNIDIALARAVEVRTGAPLDAARFQGLVAQCRAAKERLLADAGPDAIRLSVPGRGGAVIGGAVAAELTRTEVVATVLDGFFPRVAAAARPRRSAGLGLREFGLPYAEDPEITRHVAEFLARQREAVGQNERALARPDAILWNGGALEPAVVRERIAEVIGAWHAPDGAWRPAVLEGESLHLAVARGAAYYGLARRGQGVRVGSGAARTYYLGLGDDRVLCLVPRGMEEGAALDIAAHEFELLANRAVAFPLYTATDRTGEAAGEILHVPPGALAAMPPIRTVLRFGRKLVETALPVHLEVRLTEIGTLELWLRSRTTEHRWRLEFRLRDVVGEPAGGEGGLVVEPARVAEASALLTAVFAGDDDPVTITRRLEGALGAGRDGWPLAAIRALWDVLWPLEAARARSPEHETRWLNLAGFLLRPGFGDPADDLRVNRLWRVLGADLCHPRAVQCRAEWWNLWKRVAGGLTARQQQHLQHQVAPMLLRRGKPKGPRPGPQELREMWQAIGACERLAGGARAELGAALVVEAEKGRATDQELWALARLGARVPIYGPQNCVVARETAAEWSERLLRAAWPRPESYAFALAQLARVTGDRTRDLDPALRTRIAGRLEGVPESARLARLVREAVPLEAREEARLLDEALPAGLRLRTPEA